LVATVVTMFGALAAGCGDGAQATGDTSTATDGDATGDGVAADTIEVEQTACTPATGQDGEPVACVGGRLVDEAGAAIPGLKVSACTLQTCIIGETGADGRYRINKLPVAPHKIEVLGQLKGFATMVFYQPTTAGVVATPGRDIVMPTLVDAPVAWAPADGGAVTIAGGMLTLDADPGVLHYPLGTIDKSVLAVELDPLDLPPFDSAPWVGEEAATRVFIVNPFPVFSDTAVAMTVHGAAGVSVGATYQVYTADQLEGVLESAGTATADGAGNIVLDAGAELKTLTTIIVVPDP
jgi:hypothetical protein